MKVKINIPDYAYYVCDKLYNNGFQVYLNGGSVRDYFLERDVNDYDFCTDATTDESYKLFNDDPNIDMIGTCGLIHGTIKIYIGDNEPVDITEFGNDPRFCYESKINEYYEKDIYDDVSRRDFTMNSIVYNPITNEIIDVYHGINDINDRILRFVSTNPKDAIERDPFLILRAYRQSITLGFKMDGRTYKTICYMISSDPKILNRVSKWRQGNELRKILNSNFDNLPESSFSYFVDYIAKMWNKEIHTCERLASEKSFNERVRILFEDKDIEKILEEFEWDEDEIESIVYGGSF